VVVVLKQRKFRNRNTRSETGWCREKDVTQKSRHKMVSPQNGNKHYAYFGATLCTCLGKYWAVCSVSTKTL